MLNDGPGVMGRPNFSTRKRRVFDSVFASTKLTQPTPFATPTNDFTTPGQPFGGPIAAALVSQPAWHAHNEDHHVSDQVRWDRAWHTATHFLCLQPISADTDSLEALNSDFQPPSSTVLEALHNVLDSQARLPLASHTEDIAEWHTRQARHHFLSQTFPMIRQVARQQNPEDVLIESLKLLHAAHDRYVQGISCIAEQAEQLQPGAGRTALRKFLRSLHAVISNSVADHLKPALRAMLRRYTYIILGLPYCEDGRTGISPVDARTEKLCLHMLSLVESLGKVGLAGENFQVVFAEIMNDAMTGYIQSGFKGTWSLDGMSAIESDSGNKESRDSILPRMVHHANPSRCAINLCEWVEERYSKLVVLVLKVLDNVEVSWSDKEKWKELSIGRLALLRTNELFDIVSNWPNSDGALHDLRTSITIPQRRLHLTEVFAKALHDRLLHPGTSTLAILQTYISMIWSFHALDHSKVLLDRVAYPLQVYLCSREDTVRIIITGLLSDIVDSQGKPVEPGGGKLTELAQILHKGTEQISQKATEEGLDWHDLEWVPDPVDAGPGYRRSKNADVIGTMIGVLGSQDVFIKEFQNIVGEHLLKHDGVFEKEIKVLELLKTQFGEAALQSCEVMLKDIQDSGRVNALIRRNQGLAPGEEGINAMLGDSEGQSRPSLNAKILSRLFWPQLQDDEYKIPEEIMALQKHYENGFEILKSSRKLTWLHALGQATVELEFEDRNFTEEVHTWQATVIYAFQSPNVDTSLQRSVSDLVTELSMDETLVRSALNFWVSKLVLHEISKDTFTVLETLNQEDRQCSNAQAVAAAAANESTDDVGSALAGNEGLGSSEKMQMYWQFIQGMLTNSSREMALAQIAMMLKMLIAEGFPHGNEELQEFLGEKVASGELEFAGGKYRLKR